MKNKVFTDTGFWIALINKHDLNHEMSKILLEKLNHMI
jgi:predicted nucleic acid-binding protein